MLLWLAFNSRWQRLITQRNLSYDENVIALLIDHDDYSNRRYDSNELRIWVEL